MNACQQYRNFKILLYLRPLNDAKGKTWFNFEDTFLKMFFIKQCV